MSNHTIYTNLQTAKANGEKKFAVLIDPDKVRLGNMDTIINLAIQAQVDYFFIGGRYVGLLLANYPQAMQYPDGVVSGQFFSAEL